MTGHQQIILARQNGLKPKAVFLMVGIEPAGNTFYDQPENALRFGSLPEVFVRPEELNKPLDLRFLVGMPVHIHTPEICDKCVELVEAVADAGATRIVMAALRTGELLQYENGEWIA